MTTLQTATCTLAIVLTTLATVTYTLAVYFILGHPIGSKGLWDAETSSV